MILMKVLSYIFLSFALVFSLYSYIYAAGSTNVSATVTVQNVSVSVSDASVSYGIISAGASEDTTSTGVNDTQTATNDGNVTEDLNIRGADSANWTLSETSGSDQYMHEFCTSNCDSSPAWTSLTTTNQTLANGVAVIGTQDFDLRVTAPNPSSVDTQETLTVTIQASAN